MDTEPFPRAALIAVACLLGLTIAGTAAVRLARLNAPDSGFTAPHATLLSARSLRFIDIADGSVIVRDSDTGARVTTLEPGSGAFVRGVMRGLAHDRKVRGIGSAPAFRLSQWSNGQLDLEDTATGRHIDLDAFGATNHDAFVKLLHPAGAPS